MAPKAVQAPKEVTDPIQSVKHENFRIIHGNIYKVLDGGLCQDTKTGKAMTLADAQQEF